MVSGHFSYHSQKYKAKEVKEGFKKSEEHENIPSVPISTRELNVSYSCIKVLCYANASATRYGHGTTAVLHGIPNHASLYWSMQVSDGLTLSTTSFGM